MQLTGSPEISSPLFYSHAALGKVATLRRSIAREKSPVSTIVIPGCMDPNIERDYELAVSYAIKTLEASFDGNRISLADMQNLLDELNSNSCVPGWGISPTIATCRIPAAWLISGVHNCYNLRWHNQNADSRPAASDIILRTSRTRIATVWADRVLTIRRD